MANGEFKLVITGCPPDETADDNEGDGTTDDQRLGGLFGNTCISNMENGEFKLVITGCPADDNEGDGTTDDQRLGGLFGNTCISNMENGEFKHVADGCTPDDKSDHTTDDTAHDDGAADGMVTLRRKQVPKSSKSVAGDGGPVAPGDDDYIYADLLDVPTARSRRQQEIGSDKLISDEDLRLAATLVHDAMEGRTVEFKTEPRYVRSYNLYKSWWLTNLLYVAHAVNLSLAIFEEPALKDYAFPYQVTMAVEALCLVYFSVRTLHHAHWRLRHLSWRDSKNVLVIVILTLTVIDMIAYVIAKTVSPDNHHVRYSRILRASLVVNFSDGRQLRRAWRNIRRTVQEIVHVVVLFYFIIFVYALVAYKIFTQRTDIEFPDGSPYFKDYLECVWLLYVLVTTSNNPDVVLPAYDKNRLFGIFFGCYILVCIYLLLNMLLAVTYHTYRENMKREIKTSCRNKKRKLGQAFDVIKIIHHGEDMVTYNIWKRLLRLTKPGIAKNQADLLMLILDMNRSGRIERNNFMNVADLLNLPVSEVKDRITWLEAHWPSLYNSTPSEWLKTLVDTMCFMLLLDAVVVVHVTLIAFSVESIDVTFSVIFALEILLKLYTHGPRKFAGNLYNWGDVIITASSVFYVTIDSALPESSTWKGKLEAFQVMNILRIFRIFRFLVHIKRFKIIMETAVSISMSILMYGGIIFIFFYMFAIIGMEAFQGRIRFYGDKNVTNVTNYCGAAELKGSVFFTSGYCNNNFNDVMNAFMVLSNLMIGNNWQIITNGYVLVTNKAARLYFMAFHLSVNIVVMNIVTAFVVDMFMYVYTIQKANQGDSPVEAKIKQLGLGIDAETGLEISSPLTDAELNGVISENGTSEPPPRRARPRPWLERGSKFEIIRKVEDRLSRIGAFNMKKRRSDMAPTLSRFDGIRFHLKKSGYTKIEILLQQLFENETDTDIPGSHESLDISQLI